MDIIERKAGRMEKLLLIDGNSILNRAFYGLPDLSTSQGVHTIPETLDAIGTVYWSGAY